MITKDLNSILASHKDWLRGSGTRAILDGMDLKNVDLTSAYLQGAYLLSTNLTNAKLHGTNLDGATLCNANLYGANLAYAKLQGAILRDARLKGANLRHADLRHADLRDVDLKDANLNFADLDGCNLFGANLQNAILYGAKNVPAMAFAQTNIVPEGDLIVWKRCTENKIVKLGIPRDAKRSNATGRKCRASFSDVLEISEGRFAYSLFVPGFIYEVGKRVQCNYWELDRWLECGGGIHFFLTREEALIYV